MTKYKWTLHFSSLLLTAVIMYFIVKTVIKNSDLVIKYNNYLPYILILILINVCLAVYFLYRKVKKNQIKNFISKEMKEEVNKALEEDKSKFDDAFETLIKISKKHNLE